MAELSKSEKYDMLVKHVTGIERPIGSKTILIAVDLLLKSFVDDVALENKKIAPEIKNIPCFQDDKITETNFDKDNKQSLYRELLEDITMTQNSIIKDLSIIYGRDKDISKIAYFAGKLSGLNEMFELIHLRYLAENEKKGIK